MKTRSIVLASAAAALFAAGASAPALADHHESEAKVKCEGVNQCKGHSACKTAKNACSGQNACKGQGFEMKTAEECAAAKAAAEKK